jgi:hypothetical protein
MLTPTYRIALGSSTIVASDASSRQPLLGLVADSRIGAPAATATLLFASGSDLSPSPGDSVTLELGYDDTTRVFTGVVGSVARDFDLMTVHALSPAIALARMRVNQTYSNVNCGGVVSDLAQQASVDTDTIDDGFDLPAYAVTDRKSAFAHCVDLGERTGFELYATSEGKLVFSKFAKVGPDRAWTYGRDLIMLSVAQRKPSFGKVEVWGESPASSEGQDASSWLTADFSSFIGDAGSGGTFRLSDPAVRTKQAAEDAAKGRLAWFSRRGTFARARLPGDATVAIGDAVSILLAPDDKQNGLYQVARVRHELSKARGFVTETELCGAGDPLGAVP